MPADIEAVRADITVQAVDAIVNAGNGALSHGGGVARAIAVAAGPALERESLAHPRIPVGGAGFTCAGDLPCRWVIHAVGPRWTGGDSGEPALLASAYRSAVMQAEDLGVRTLAFSSLSTGIYGFPVERAAPIAVGAVRQACEGARFLQLVRFCLFSSRDLAAYQRALARDAS